MLQTKVSKWSDTRDKNTAYGVIFKLQILALFIHSTSSLILCIHEEQVGFTLFFTNAIKPIRVEDSQRDMAALVRVPPEVEGGISGWAIHKRNLLMDYISFENKNGLHLTLVKGHCRNYRPVSLC